MIRTLAFAGYRSLRELRIAVGPLTAITGGNGTGKPNVYRALRPPPLDFGWRRRPAAQRLGHVGSPRFP